jgi:hypothetical protein
LQLKVKILRCLNRNLQLKVKIYRRLNRIWYHYYFFGKNLGSKNCGLQLLWTRIYTQTNPYAKFNTNHRVLNTFRFKT